MRGLIFVLFLLHGLSPLSAEGADGKALYDRECAACHGLDGSADTKLGRNLIPPARDLRPKILTRKEIESAIASGRAKTGMHGHGHRLTDEEIEAIVNYVLSFEYRANPKRGKRTFEMRCARCHGKEATGRSYPGAPNLLLSELSDEAMARIIRHGHPGTVMGGMKDELSNGVIADIIAWLRLKRYGLSD